jgi:hypothetical protein
MSNENSLTYEELVRRNISRIERESTSSADDHLLKARTLRFVLKRRIENSPLLAPEVRIELTRRVVGIISNEESRAAKLRAPQPTATVG